MAYAHFTFDTTAFIDSDAARSQSINDQSGHSLAAWLMTRLQAAGIDAGDVMAEDHGWDFTVAHKGAKYVCACSANDGDMPFEAHVTISKSRSIRDRLRGRNPFTEDDPVLTAIDAALRGSSDVTKLEREPISK